MEMSFKQLEFLLWLQFGVNDEGQAAFRSRLQHLQRAKVPAGVNTGKGRAATYGWAQLVELVTVLDLIDVGLSPEAARKVVGFNLERLLGLAASFAAEASDEAFAAWIVTGRCPTEHTRIISASAGVLQALSGGEDFIFECMTGSQFIASISDDSSYKPASAVVIVSRRLLTMMDMLRASMIGPHGDAIGTLGIIEDFRAWARTVSVGAVL